MTRGKKVIIGDMTKEYKMSKNKEMESLQGKKAKILSAINNVYDGKVYFKLDIDMGQNTWSEEMLIFN